MISEFKQFISRGNILDLAIAVMMGAAFGKIVESLVQDLMMPMIGVLFGGVNFEGLHIAIGQEVIRYGRFLQTLVNFLFISLSIFMMIKFLYRLKGEKGNYQIKNTTNLEVLQEIRDLLKEKNEDIHSKKTPTITIQSKKKNNIS